MNYGSKWSEKLNYILASKHPEIFYQINKIETKTILSIQSPLPEANIPRMTSGIMDTK
jgi:hypothetical protein